MKGGFNALRDGATPRPAAGCQESPGRRSANCPAPSHVLQGWPCSQSSTPGDTWAPEKTQAPPPASPSKSGRLREEARGCRGGRGPCPEAAALPRCLLPLRGGSGRGRQGEEPRSRLPPGARPRSHQPLSTQGIVSGVGTSGLPQGQSRVAVVWVPGPSVAPLLTSRGEAVPGQQRGAAAGRAAKFAAAGPPAGPAQQRWAGAQACLTHRRVHRGGAGTGGGEYEPWPVRRESAGGRARPREGGAVTADAAWEKPRSHGLGVRPALQPVASADLAPVP